MKKQFPSPLILIISYYFVETMWLLSKGLLRISDSYFYGLIISKRVSSSLSSSIQTDKKSESKQESKHKFSSIELSLLL